MGNNFTTSTYLIDASKKIYLKGKSTNQTVFNDEAPESLVGVPVIAAGIIDDKALANLGFEYKEGFTSGKKVAEKRFEDVVKPATAAVKALTGSLPIMKGISSRIDGAEKLRTTAIEGYTLLAGTTTLLGNGDTDVTRQLKNWEAVYAYDPPVRKSPPTVDLQNAAIDITFRYGACNVFDAYWEVYYPITKLYLELFPKAAAANENGLTQYTGQFLVPYEQQVFVELLKNLIPVGTKTDSKGNQTPVAETDNIYTDLRELAAAKSTLDREAELFDARKDNLLNGLDKSLGNLTIEKARKSSNFASLIHERIFIPIGLGERVGVEQIEQALPADDPEGSVYTAISGLISTEIDKMKSSGDVMITDGSWKGGNDFLDYALNFGNPSLEKLLPDDSGGIKIIPKANNTKSTKANVLKDVFDSLVTFEPRLIGKTLKTIYDNWATSCCTDMYFGFPCVYARSLKDINTIYAAPDDYARVHISNIILDNIAINFNFANTDERGYPLEGHVILKGMWNCALPQDVLNFKGYAVKNGDAVPKDTVYLTSQHTDKDEQDSAK